MKNNRLKKTFTFSNKAEDVASVLESCVEFIKKSEDLIPVQPELLSRIRWVVTELLINGAKHVKAHQSLLQIEIYGKLLTVKIEDQGAPLKLSVDQNTKIIAWPLTDFAHGQQFEVYRNGMDSLRILIASDHSATFKVVEMEDVDMPQLLVTTSEHFGLMIIAKSSDAFSYVYDDQTNNNIFTVTFNYIE